NEFRQGLCRASQHECDPPEYCTGRSAQCPRDIVFDPEVCRTQCGPITPADAYAGFYNLVTGCGLFPIVLDQLELDPYHPPIPVGLVYNDAHSDTFDAGWQAWQGPMGPGSQDLLRVFVAFDEGDPNEATEAVLHTSRGDAIYRSRDGNGGPFLPTPGD